MIVLIVVSECYGVKAKTAKSVSNEKRNERQLKVADC